MKHLETQNYYQILEIPYQADWVEIQKAYELAKRTYHQDAIASYSLFSKGEQQSILDKIEEAYHVLGDPEKRKQYDEALEIATPDIAPNPDNPPPATTTPSHAPAVPEIVTGAMLQAIRERKRISLEQISETTRINSDYFVRIEMGQYASLPPEVYLRSYLQQYAKILQCGAPMVEGYLRGYLNWKKAQNKGDNQ